MPAANAPFRLFGRAPLLLAALVCLLGLPAFVGLVHSNAQAIREGENRNMASRPPLALWRDNAPEYIGAWEKRLKDSVGFRFRASVLYLKMKYYLFHDRAIGTVTMGGSGHVFLNSISGTPYVFFDALCVREGDPSPELLRDLDAVMAASTRYCRRHGARAVFALVPSSLALYADKLPPDVPPALRRACRAYPTRDHAIARLMRRGEETGAYRVFYPYGLFNAHKHEAHFWPKELFHWEGRSAYLFARRLFLESGLLETASLDDPAELAPAPKDDLAVFFGFSRPVAAWRYPYADRPTTLRPEKWLEDAYGGRARLDLHSHSVTEKSLTPKTALMITNSFGEALRPHLAQGFAHLYAANTNLLAKQADFFADALRRIRPDYVFFVYDDVNLVNLPNWLAGFVELERRAASSPEADDSRPDSPF